MNKDQHTGSVIALLRKLISIPSLSREEDRTAQAFEQFFSERGVKTQRHLNNVWACNQHFDPAKPTILLNSHHDTVPPNKSYTLNPFEPIEKAGKLFGLGSNDAGGPLVALLATFLNFQDRPDLTWNLVFAATAEEEISGRNGVEALIPVLPPISCAIVGEPTLMDMAVAERGLMVLDCTAHGKAGHAARNEGENAIDKALHDITRLQEMRFPRESAFLGAVKLTVTVIETDNKAHNIVPSLCRFVVDVRVNELYSLEEILEQVKAQIDSEVSPRSTRLRSTSIDEEHPLVKAGKMLGKKTYGSPTTSDKALMPWPTLKMGPGDSARSHTADEFIFIREIEEGIRTYTDLLSKVILREPA